MYEIKPDNKTELLCVLFNSRDDNNKQLLDLVVELCDKRVDKLLFIGYCIGTGIRYRYSRWTMVNHNQL